MAETVHLWLEDAEMTVDAGASLVRSLQRVPVTLWLTGELGAGKTTFLQGLARGLGVAERLTSPTFALEQRYATTAYGELVHLDLYRLEGTQARSLVASTDDHPGIRCVEWADRLPSPLRRGGIHLAFAEEQGRPGRGLTIRFEDIALPSFEEIERWREELYLPHPVAHHCDAVGEVAIRLGRELLKRGHIVRLEAVRRAGQAHDLLRFVDFHRGAAHIERAINPLHVQAWEAEKSKHPGARHEAACAAFLRERGFGDLGEIVRTHGLTLARTERVTIEQQLLYYADKRAKLDEVVSLQERFRDFTARYSKNGRLEESDAWYEEARRTERELFPEGPPF